MPTILEQRSLFSRETYTLDYNGVQVHKSGVNQNLEWLIAYENIPATRFFSRSFRPGAITLGVFLGSGVCALNFVLLGVGSNSPNLLYGILYYLLCTAPVAIPSIIIAALVLWFTRHEYVGYGVPGNGFILDANKPSRAAVQAFLQELHTGKVAYLREVYLDHATTAPVEESLRRLIWLKDLGALSADEFDTRRRELGSEKPPSAGNLGFRR